MDISDDQLTRFKAGMHITHKLEDTYLTGLLSDSADYISGIVNTDDLNNPKFFELVCNRARYAYNDQLKDFDTDYRSPLMNLSIDQLILEADTDGNSD